MPLIMIAYSQRTARVGARGFVVHGAMRGSSQIRLSRGMSKVRALDRVVSPRKLTDFRRSWFRSAIARLERPV